MLVDDSAPPRHFPKITDSSSMTLHSRRLPTPTVLARFAAVPALVFLIASGATAQAVQQVASSDSASTIVALPSNAADVPFSVGERLDYEVRFGRIRVGSGSMEVRGISSVRGRPSYHAVFQYGGSIPFYKVNDVHQTWFDVETLASLRFHQDIDEGNYERTRRFEIFPERGVFRENDKPEEPTVAQPLDDAAFLYFIRTLPLNVGDTYTYSRYFKTQGNPVIIKVVRKETVKVPAGTFNTVVLQPTFQTKGIFSEGGQAEVWITDDDARIMVQMKSKLSFGSLNLFLRKHVEGK